MRSRRATETVRLARMGKLLALTFALSLATLCPVAAQAQLGIGVRGGLVSTKFGGDIDYQNRRGFYAAAFASLSLSELWSLHPEVAFVQKGATDENLRATPQGVTLFDRKNRLTYIELLLPLTYSPQIERGQLQPRLYAAPAVGLELSCTTEFENVPELSDSYDCDENIDVLGGTAFTRTRSLDFGVVIGAGIDAGGGRTLFTADVRYDLGVADIDLDGVQEVKNRALEFLIGVRYRLSP